MVLMLSFDDATQDHFEVALPLLKRHGCRAIFFIPTSKLNRTGYMTAEQLRAVSRAGSTRAPTVLLQVLGHGVGR